MGLWRSRKPRILRLHILLVALAGLISQSAWSAPAQPATNQWLAITVQHDKLDRHLRYYLPDSVISGSNPAPLVILLHGGGGNAKRALSGGMREWLPIAQQAGVVLIAPDGTSPKTGLSAGRRLHWNDCRPAQSAAKAATQADDVGFISQVINWAVAQLNVDAQRIYVVGVSNGGMMSYRLAQELDHQIAAIAAFVANEPSDSECQLPNRAVPVFIANGTSDKLMPYHGGQIGKGDRGQVLSTKATIDYWKKRHGVTASAKQFMLADTEPDDQSTLRLDEYHNSQHVSRAAVLALLEVRGGGHTVPTQAHPLRPWAKLIVGPTNRDAEGARLAWAFLRQHQLPRSLR